jgi:dienelactone hydrolase
MRFDLTLAIVLALSFSAPGLELHIALTGNDANPGTLKKPFASIDGARLALRKLRASNSAEPVTVLLHGGNYRVAQPIVFEPADSGKPGAAVSYRAAPGEKPILSGGRQITGWKRVGDKLWTVEIPDARAGRWNFNQLFVNGEPRQRARTPNQGFFRVAGCPEGTPKTANYHKDCQTFEFKPGDIRADWTNLEDVEVIVYHFWTDSHLPIRSVNTQSNLVTFAHKAGKVFTDDFSENGARYIVENVYEALDAPGEWYLNRRTGVLYYVPMEGEDPGKVEVIAPELPAFMQFRGSAKQLQSVEHLGFYGLQFAYTLFQLPPGNPNDQQGSASVSAAVTLTGTRQCRFEACRFRNLGTWAIEVGRGCSENAFVGNEIASVAAGGFRFNGGTDRDHPLERNSRNEVVGNRLHHYGTVYPSAVGVLLMNTEGNLVAHNEIHHGFYTGISVGWVWGYQRSISQGNRIEFNHIHDIGQGLLSDMGGIYTLGVSPGTTLRNNLIHDVDANHYGGWGIYHDEGSTHLLVESNVVYGTKFAAFNIHFAKEVTVRNNIFALGRLEQLSRGRQEPHKSVFFENNIVYWTGGELLAQNWKDGPYSFYLHPKDKSGTATLTNTFDFDWNLYYDPNQKLEEVRFAGATWEEWQKRGKDLHSVYADPLFVNPTKGDFQLKPGSPAFALGFKPIDLREVGPLPRHLHLPDPLQMENGKMIRGDRDWLEKRRPELLELFAENVYGRQPVGRPAKLTFKVTDSARDAMDGKATRKQVRVSYSGPGGEGSFNLVLFTPNERTAPAPCFLLICNRSIENMDPTRKVKSPFWPAEQIVARGYGAAAFYNGEVEPDNKEAWKNGVHKIFNGPTGPKADSWGTIAAWAWGASRAMDYLETDPDVDRNHVAVVGHSRGGKTALWAGAEDERFAMAVSNDSGCTGAAIARAKRGEQIADINRAFPYWFCENYKRFNGRPEDLPVDQHQLIALMAPRLVYVASASEDIWADPKNEFLAGVLAGPVYRLFGLEGIAADSCPPAESPVHAGSIGYHLRTGGHNLTEYDWARFMDFADRHWRRGHP